MDLHLDWLTGTFVGDRYFGETGLKIVVNTFLPFIPFNVFIRSERGQSGYDIRYTIDNCITVLAASDNVDELHRMGVCIMFSGKGLALLSSWGVSPEDFMKSLYGVPGFRFTRLDIACDVRSRDELDIEKVWDCVPKVPSDSRKFCSKWRSARFVGSVGNVLGRTLYVGSRSSDSLVRFYDKAAEQGLTDGSYWFRVELELHRVPANSFVDKCVGGSLSLGDVFCGCLADRLNFGEGDVVRGKFKPFAWWINFLRNCAKVALSTRIAPGNLSVARTANWACTALSRLLFKCVMVFGADVVTEWVRVGFHKMRVEDWQQVALERANNPSAPQIPPVLTIGRVCGWRDMVFDFKSLFDRGKLPDYKLFEFRNMEMEALL